jgi:hypothetical protein
MYCMHEIFSGMWASLLIQAKQGIGFGTRLPSISHPYKEEFGTIGGGGETYTSPHSDRSLSLILFTFTLPIL